MDYPVGDTIEQHNKPPNDEIWRTLFMANVLANEEKAAYEQCILDLNIYSCGHCCCCNANICSLAASGWS